MDLIDRALEFENEKRTSYKYDGKWAKTSLRLEEIKIKGKETFIDSVIYTHHGPVTYDYSFKSNNALKGYAMKWAGHIGHNFTDLFYNLNRSKNYVDYRNAIKPFNSVEIAKIRAFKINFLEALFFLFYLLTNNKYKYNLSITNKER